IYIPYPDYHYFTSAVTGGYIRTTGDFLVYHNDFNPENSAVILYGASDSIIYHAVGSSVNTLIIEKGAARQESETDWRTDRNGNRVPLTRNNTVTATSNLDINGNFYLHIGYFIAPPIMSVNNDWDNDVGADGFIEGAGKVIFDGNTWSYILSDEIFNDLELNKIDASLRLRLNVVNSVICNSYDWNLGTLHVSGGSFTALDLVDPGIYGLINLSAGTINFHQDLSQRMDLNGTLTISDGTFNVYGGMANSGCLFGLDGPAVLNMSGGVLDFKDTGIQISLNNDFTENISGGRIRISGDFWLWSYDFDPAGGTIEMYGSGDDILQDSYNSVFHNLEINKTGGSIEGRMALNINGDFSILAGSFEAPTTMDVGGNWTLEPGAAFDADGGTVTFNRIGDLQIVSGANTFYNLIDAHTGNALSFQDATSVSGTMTVTNLVTFHDATTLNTVLNNQAAGQLVFYDNHVSTISSYTGGGALRSLNAGNHVIVNDLAQDGLYGSFLANAGHLEFHQDPSSFTIISVTCEIINDGIIDLYGGNTGALFAQNGDVSFTMDSGEFNVVDGGLTITNTAYTCGFDVSGGTIRVNGSWLDERSYGTFDPSGGTVEFMGSGDNYVTAHPDGWFQHLKVNKATTLSSNLLINSCTINSGLSIDAANVVSLGGNVICQNAGDIIINAGTLDLWGHTLTSTGNVVVNGTLALDNGAVLQISNAKSLTVNSGGTLQTLGFSGDPATITHNTAGYYALNIESGATIAAEYTIFEYMNSAGVNVKDGAWVDPAHSLDYCTFRLGYTSQFAINETLLALNNAQHIGITGASFPNLPFQYPSYNVSKTLDQGSVYFANWSGNYAGPGYERDPNDRIYWEGSGIPPVYDLSIGYNPFQNRVELDWTYPIDGAQFLILRADMPYGTYTEVGSTSLTSWSQSIFTVGQFFYRVKAVVPDP
ncbi:MAG: hypothetical protein ACP5F3_04730, partial [Candidatus Syntrophosphaera sp.]